MSNPPQVDKAAKLRGGQGPKKPDNFFHKTLELAEILCRISKPDAFSDKSSCVL
jgi:hypothetical protein